MQKSRAVHLLISGHVQGVFYRQSTQNQARRLGISGWVRNLPDGRVEAKVWGHAEAVNALVRWCHTGPANAYVTDVAVADAQAETGSNGFHIR